MLNQNLSAKLKNHRKSVWMTQKQLSDKSGVSLTEIRNIERQRTNASLDTVDLLADALEISPIVLILRTGYGAIYIFHGMTKGQKKSAPFL